MQEINWDYFYPLQDENYRIQFLVNKKNEFPYLTAQLIFLIRLLCRFYKAL